MTSELPPRPPDWRTGLRTLFHAPITQGARRAVVVLFVVSFVLSGGAYVLATSATHKAVANQATILDVCRAGNEFRAQQLQVWGKLIAISPPPPHQTRAQARRRQRLIAVFEAYLRKVYAPRNCMKRFG